MRSLQQKNEALFSLILVACLILANLLSIRHFFRIDLTADNKYTLSMASRETMKNLKDGMVVTAYFTEGLPPPYSSNARYVRDLLEEYRVASKGKLSFEFIDPIQEESADDKAKKKEVKQDIFGRMIREPTGVERDLADLGVQPVEIRVIEDDQQQQKRAYMGLVVRFQGKTETIPVVQDIPNLERDMTGLMRKLVRAKTPVVALVQNTGGVSIQQFRNALSQNVSIKEVDLSSEAKELDEADGLLFVGHPSKVSEQALQKLNHFVHSGKNAAFFIDRHVIDPETLHVSPVADDDNPLLAFLSGMGVNVQKDLVADIQCASISVSEKRGQMVFAMPVKYPFIPEVRSLNQDSSISRGLTAIMMPLVSSLSTQLPKEVKVLNLAKSSKNSWIESEPFNLDPRRDWKKDDIKATGPYTLIVQVEGKLPDYYQGANQAQTAQSSRMIVSGSSAIMWDQFFGGPNQAFALNVGDWLVADSGLLSMRVREFADAPLNSNLSDSTRFAVKYINVLGVPALLVLYGLVRWRLREAKRRRVALAV